MIFLKAIGVEYFVKEVFVPHVKGKVRNYKDIFDMRVLFL